ncbi:Apoptosis-inducing factor [Musa troglodytarum]|uniref:Apoptosis-inducing factor n=1 Tax=Musa troglodytarum TaxID=320322 RepID=A0A9E7HX66_9LILI|nr:Apoptosis-inducing factor [Musa troglodytarum]
MEAGAGDRRVVVVGGGVAGAMLAKHMQFDTDVVLIDSKEYYEVPWARNRSMVEPPFAERSLIQHTDYLSNARVTASPAIDVTESEVLTAEGRTFAYDYLVIATGHVDSTPRSRKDRLEQFKKGNSSDHSSSASSSSDTHAEASYQPSHDSLRQQEDKIFQLRAGHRRRPNRRRALCRDRGRLPGEEGDARPRRPKTASNPRPESFREGAQMAEVEGGRRAPGPLHRRGRHLRGAAIVHDFRRSNHHRRLSLRVRGEAAGLLMAAAHPAQG